MCCGLPSLPLSARLYFLQAASADSKRLEKTFCLASCLFWHVSGGTDSRLGWREELQFRPPGSVFCCQCVPGPVLFILSLSVYICKRGMVSAFSIAAGLEIMYEKASDRVLTSERRLNKWSRLRKSSPPLLFHDFFQHILFLISAEQLLAWLEKSCFPESNNKKPQQTKKTSLIQITVPGIMITIWKGGWGEIEEGEGG